MADASRQHVIDSIKALLVSGKFSDLGITCGSDTYRVHKNIVCSRSGFFNRAINFGGKETQDDKINLPEDEPAMIKLLVQYLYEGEYDPTLPSDEQVKTMPRPATQYVNFPHTCDPYGAACSSDPRGSYYQICDHHDCDYDCKRHCIDFTCSLCVPPPLTGSADQLLVHAKMYEIGDKYDVVGLKDLAKEKFDRACRKFWDDDHFPIAANHAFSTTPEDDKGLRDIVCKTISDHVTLIQKPEVEALMMEFNGLAFGLFKAKALEQKWITEK